MHCLPCAPLTPERVQRTNRWYKGNIIRFSLRCVRRFLSFPFHPSRHYSNTYTYVFPTKNSQYKMNRNNYLFTRTFPHNTTYSEHTYALFSRSSKLCMHQFPTWFGQIWGSPSAKFYCFSENSFSTLFLLRLPISLMKYIIIYLFMISLSVLELEIVVQKMYVKLSSAWGRSANCSCILWRHYMSQTSPVTLSRINSPD